MSSSHAHLRYREIIPYALIAFPVAFAGIPIYIFLPEYYQSEFGVSLTVLSVVLFCMRFIDALVDPFIGVLCDRFGHYKRTLMIGVGILFCLGFYILCVPVFSSMVVNLIVGVFFATFGFSFFTIYVSTVGALWHQSSEEKSKIIGTRETLTILGVLVASILPFLLMNGLGAKVSYALYALIFIGVMIAGGFIFYFWMKGQDRKLFQKDKDVNHIYGVRRYISASDRNGGFLFLTYVMSALGSAVPGVMLVFYSRYVLDSEAYTGLYLFLYFLGAMLCIPMMRKLALRFGVLKVWQMAIIGAIFIFAFVATLGKGDVTFFLVICLLSGGCFAAEIILPNLLVAQYIDCSKRKKLGNGFYAFLAFINKFSFALATIISLPFLQMSLNESNHSESGTVWTIKIIYCALPCLLKFSAVLVLWRWQKCGSYSEIKSREVH